MIRLILLISMLLVSFLIGCTSTRSVYLPKYSKQITYFANSEEFFDGTNLKKCKLSDTAELNGYKCNSWIHFFENGQIKQFETAVDIKMHDYTIPSNSVLFFSEQHPYAIKNVWFSNDVTIENIVCKGGNKISTEFYENGRLKACFLSTDQEIQGFPCKSSLVAPIYFHSNGKIKLLTLSKDIIIADTEYKKSETISIGENGAVSIYKR